jgi:hypothetical protein
VEQEWRAKACPTRQQPDRKIQRDSVDVVSKELAHPDVHVGHQRERCEEVLAELAVGDPRSSFRQRLERQGVDQRGMAVTELDVVRARVTQGHPVIHRDRLHAERREPGVTQL